MGLTNGLWIKIAIAFSMAAIAVSCGKNSSNNRPHHQPVPLVADVPAPTLQCINVAPANPEIYGPYNRDNIHRHPSRPGRGHGREWRPGHRQGGGNRIRYSAQLTLAANDEDFENPNFDDQEDRNGNEDREENEIPQDDDSIEHDLPPRPNQPGQPIRPTQPSRPTRPNPPPYTPNPGPEAPSAAPNFCGCQPGFIPACAPGAAGLMCVPTRGMSEQIAIWGYRDGQFQWNGYGNYQSQSCMNVVAQICLVTGPQGHYLNGARCKPLHPGSRYGIWVHR